MKYGNIEGDSEILTINQYDCQKDTVIMSVSHRMQTPLKLDTNIEAMQYTIKINENKLPTLILPCNSNSIFPAIVSELSYYQYCCIQQSKAQLLFLRVENVNFCNKVKQICEKKKPHKESLNNIIKVSLKDGHIVLKSLSGCHSELESISAQVARVIINTANLEVDQADNENYLSPFQLLSEITSNVLETLNYDAEKPYSLISTLTTSCSKKLLQSKHQELNQMILELLQQYNHKKLKKSYYNLAIEKIIYESINDQFFGYYVQQYLNAETELQQKKKQIAQNYTEDTMMDFLEIKSKFRIPCQFLIGANELVKLNYINNPRDKLRAIQLMICLIKSFVYEACCEDLCTMDDELPVMIYIMQISQFDNQFATLAYVDDFCNTDSSIEAEKRSITTLKVSLEYIQNDWKL